MVGLETRPLKAFFFKGSRTTPDMKILGFI